MTTFFKWSALLLVFFNIALLVWIIVEPEEKPFSTADTQRNQYTQQGEQIRLVGELDAEVVESMKFSEAPEVADEEPETRELLASAPYCPSLGPFGSRDSMKQVGQKLAKSGLGAKARTVKVDAGEKYRVYLPPHSSYDEAARVLKKLRAKNIDSYIMTEEPHANAISLGIFSTRESAEGLSKKMQSYGYPADILMTQFEKEVFWLDLKYVENKDKLDEILARVMSNAKGLTRIDSPCKVVALAQ